MRLVRHARGQRASFALADLHDYLAALLSSEFVIATGDDPLTRNDSAHFANYVAAMAEHRAYALDVPAPAWALAVAPLQLP